MGRKRLIDIDNLLFDDELVEALGAEGLWVYPILWGIAEDWGGYEPKYGSIALRSGALRLTKETVQKVIETLIDMGKILPYQVKGKTYHWIKNFLKHQNLNNPSPPVLPLPPWIKWEEAQYPSGKKYAKYSLLQEMLPENLPETPGSLPVAYQETTGSPRNETETKLGGDTSTLAGGSSRRTASADHTPSPGVTDRVDRVDGKPGDDSQNRPAFFEEGPTGDNPQDDIDIKAAGGGEAAGEAPVEEVLDGGNGNGVKGTKHRFTANDLGRLWNDTADPVFPRVIIPLSERRVKKFGPAIRGQPDPVWWRTLIQRVNATPFLRGDNDRGWRADLEFVVKRNEDILEGKYDRARSQEGPPPNADPGCLICGGDGWEFVEEGGERLAKPCRCTSKVRPIAGRLRKGGDAWASP